MEPRVDIGRLHLRYVMRGKRIMDRSRLDDVAVRLLPTALERELGRFDDGTLVVLRRVSAFVRLRADGSTTEWARLWAESLASEVRVLAARVRARPGFAEDDVGDTTQRLELAADLLCCGCVTPVDDDVSAGFRQPAGERASKASRRAGDQGSTAGE